VIGSAQPTRGQPARRTEPGQLLIAAPVGASVRVDGTFVGAAPLSGPVEVEPGTRTVAVTMNGFHPRTLNVVVGRGRSREVTVELEMTDQRIAAWSLLGTGIAGLGAGIVFGSLSVVRLREARDIQQEADGDLSEAGQAAYDAAMAARDDLRLGSGVSAGIGLVALLVGGPLYILDQPATPAGPGGIADDGVTVSALPLVTPSFSGGGITVRF
jgi:hypothetical protein